MVQQSIKKIMMNGMIVAIMVLLNAIILMHGYIENQQFYWWFILSIPLLLVTIYKMQQKKHADYGVRGMPPYFFRQHPDGNLFNKAQDAFVDHDATNGDQLVVYGTNIHACQPGFEQQATAFLPACTNEEDLRVTIGNHQCSQPYYSSILNIGVSGYTALATTMALHEGALPGGFAYATGEDGIHAPHFNGGDLIWQIGPAYVGCRNAKGNFDAEKFIENATRPEVKMIELQLSQEAKYAGNNLEATPGTIVPITHHTVFSNAESMLMFIELLRELSSGKPVGMRLNITSRKAFYQTCYSMQKTGIIPDFISVADAEDTLACTCKTGMPLYEALAFVSATLQAYALKAHIQIIATGHMVSGFDIMKALALGANACCSTGSFVPASSFTHAAETAGEDFTVGAADRRPQRYTIFNVPGKKAGVADFHRNTLQATLVLMRACGFKNLSDITVPGFFRLMNTAEIKKCPPVNALNKLPKTKNSPILN